MSLLNMTVWAGAATDAANETLAAAQTALEEAKADLEPKMAAQTEAHAAVDAVQAAYDEAVAAIDTTAVNAAKEALDAAKEAAVEAAAQVEDMVADLPTEITEENAESTETAIKAARTGYEALTDELKELLTDEDALVAALETAENNLAIFKAGIPAGATNIITTETTDFQAVLDANETVYIMPGTYDGIAFVVSKSVTLIPVGIVLFKDNTNHKQTAVYVTGGDININIPQGSHFTITDYLAGIKTDQNASGTISIIGADRTSSSLTIQKNRNSAGESTDIMMHAHTRNKLTVKDVTFTCQNSDASGIDLYIYVSEEQTTTVLFENSNIYMNNHRYNGINLQTDTGWRDENDEGIRNHAPATITVTNCYLESCNNSGGSGVMNNWARILTTIMESSGPSPILLWF